MCIGVCEPWFFHPHSQDCLFYFLIAPLPAKLKSCLLTRLHKNNWTTVHKVFMKFLSCPDLQLIKFCLQKVKGQQSCFLAIPPQNEIERSNLCYFAADSIDFKLYFQFTSSKVNATDLIRHIMCPFLLNWHRAVQLVSFDTGYE